MPAQIISGTDIWPSIMTVVLTALVVMGSPGPSTISATATGAAYGFRRSLLYVCGLISGTGAVLVAVAFGVVSVLLSIPYGAPALLVASGAYIAYLAYRIATAPPLAAQAQRTAAAPAFTGGFLLAIANPKAYLALAAVFASTNILRENPTLDAGIKVVLLGLMIVAIHLLWLTIGVSLARLLRNPKISRCLNVLMAALLLATTVKALLS
ncbi:LysE family translocator [Labrys sp. LIt4]|uniref:Threonine transporter RhtB n=1 Tax=Labrys okinawensis TaxID=346911 RepID=A0A2S9QHH1_9HYPH|nr:MULTISPECIES: LysE family translocator [Labrys]MBP0579680.1 LysE family translocator [Labrys sp. LIt4]PRH88772.1 threonine transporter RhtB [Labrys okinawensis]